MILVLEIAGGIVLAVFLLGMLEATASQGYSTPTPETWEQKRARLAFENRCDELARRHFPVTTFDGDDYEQ